MPRSTCRTRLIPFVATLRITFGLALLGACAGKAITHPVTATVEQVPLFVSAGADRMKSNWRITFTPDGDTAYFAASDGFFPATRQATIYRAHRTGSTWSTPAVATFSGTYSDIDPFITPDGSRLYFSSIRPVDGVARGDIDLWMVDRSPEGWGDPARLGPEVNSPLDELYPSLAADGTLYFAAGPRAPQPGLTYDIFSARASGASFSPRAQLGNAVNRAADLADPNLQASWNFNPEISPDGRMLLFTSLRPGGNGLGDIYVSHLVGGAWTPAVNLGDPVNSVADEYHPTLSPDGEWLYFARRVGSTGVFHRVRTSLVAALQPPAPRGLYEAFLEAAQAQQAGSVADFRRLLRAANTFAPDNGQILFFLAREEARAGNANESLAFLERLAFQGTTRDIRVDSNFAVLQQGTARARFEAVTNRIANSAAPLVRSDTFHVLNDPDFIPEGMAWDPVDEVFYVGSLNRRSVIGIPRSGGSEEVFVPAALHGTGQVAGIRIDASRRRLWLASIALDSAAPRHSDGGGGWATLSEWDLHSGRRVSVYPAPDSTRPHLLNDLVVTASGDVYVTDTEAHALYRLRAGATYLEQAFGDDPRFRFPNGIALDPRGDRLYVAHLEGISTAPLTHETTLPLMLLPSPVGVTGGGIDGLYYCSGSLIGVQGLLGFHQVTSFSLSSDGRAITSTRPLERRHPIHDWPTTGAVVNGDFYYIANAQLRRRAPTGEISPASAPGNSTILRLPGVCDANQAGPR
jgi:hypothetical protein